MPKIEHDTDTDPGICDVESRVGVGAKVHVDKINDVSVQESVNQVSRNPSTEKTESDLRHTIVQSQGSPPNVDGHQGRHLHLAASLGIARSCVADRFRSSLWRDCGKPD